MNEQQIIEHRLWGYIDNTCSPGEKIFVKKLIAAEKEWRKQYNEMLKIHHLIIDSLELNEPSAGFLQKVRERVGAIK